MSANETIHVSETGGQKAGNLDRYDLIPVEPYASLAAFYSTQDATVQGSFNDLCAHLNMFWAGEDVDPVSGYSHLTHVAFTAFELADNLHDGYLQCSDDNGGTASRFDRIPGEALRQLAHHYGVGSLKYDDDNWCKGYDWRLSYAALNRHLWAHWMGQVTDEETGSPHIIAVAWHAFALQWFVQHKPEFDTRRKIVDDSYQQYVAALLEYVSQSVMPMGILETQLESLRGGFKTAKKAPRVVSALGEAERDAVWEHVTPGGDHLHLQWRQDSGAWWTWLENEPGCPWRAITVHKGDGRTYTEVLNP